MNSHLARVTALTAAALVAALCLPATQAHQETPRHSGGGAGWHAPQEPLSAAHADQ
jgi:hypothetical protein